MSECVINRFLLVDSGFEYTFLSSKTAFFPNITGHHCSVQSLCAVKVCVYARMCVWDGEGNICVAAQL